MGDSKGSPSLKSYVEFINDVTKRYDGKVNFDWNGKAGILDSRNKPRKTFSMAEGARSKKVNRFPYFFQRDYPLGEKMVEDYR